MTIIPPGKKMTPMQRVMGYMKKRGLRPTELFRNFDKDVSKSLSHDEVVVNLKVGFGISFRHIKNTEVTRR